MYRVLVACNTNEAFVAGEEFDLSRYARFSFALGDDDLREGINRLAAFING
jgi:hypothetical protein